MKFHRVALFVILAGAALTAIGFFLLRFIHNDLIALISFALILPYVFLHKWVGDVPDAQFWAMFVVLQLIYCLAIASLFMVILRTRKRSRLEEIEVRKGQ